MVDFKKGVPIIKGCDLMISTETTISDFIKFVPDFSQTIVDVGTGFKHGSLICNTGLNYEPENYLFFIFGEDKKISKIRISSIQHSVRCREDCKPIALHCRQWLKNQGQLTDWKFYDWGLVSYIEDFDFHWFFGIDIKFEHSSNEKLLKELRKGKNNTPAFWKEFEIE